MGLGFRAPPEPVFSAETQTSIRAQQPAISAECSALKRKVLLRALYSNSFITVMTDSSQPENAATSEYHPLSRTRARTNTLTHMGTNKTVQKNIQKKQKQTEKMCTCTRKETHTHRGSQTLQF